VTPREPRELAEHTTASFAALAAGPRRVVALVPVGSVEPHGPHLPLATDVVISRGACLRACDALAAHDVAAVVAPAVAYGVTDCAAGFAGAVSVPAAALTAFLRAIIDGLGAAGVHHVCLVNNHLEPAHDAAVRAALAEFKSGACHAGQYETSIVMAAEPALVDDAARAALPPVPISLSDQLRAGVTTFAAMGMDRAYAGDPAAATAAEGDELLGRLAEMIVSEVLEALAAAAPSP
jgi:creatinine amidohydrolase